MLCNCIICGECREASEEHIIPSAIGGNIKIKSVCKRCNENLGSHVDCNLTDCDFSLFARQLTNVRNRDNVGVNIFTTKYGWHNKLNSKVKLKKGAMFGKQLLYDGSQDPEVSVTVDNYSNQATILYSGSDYESIIKKITRSLKAVGSDLTEEEVRQKIPMDSMNIIFNVTRAKHDLIITWGDYFPCVLKIVYEICCANLGDTYTSDEVGCILKNYLYNKSYKIKSTVPINLIVCMGHANQIKNYHRIRISRNGNNVIVRIHLFECLFFKVIASNHADRYAEKLINDIKFKNVLSKE